MKISYARNMQPHRFSSSRTNYVTELTVIPGTYYKEYCFTPHNHAMLELICMEEGEMRVEAGDCKFLAKPGDLLIFNPYEPHTGVLTGERLYARYLVFNLELEQVTGSSAMLGDAALEGLVGLTRRFPNYIAASEVTARIGERLGQALELSEGSRLRRFGAAVGILGELCESVELVEAAGNLHRTRFTQTVTDFVEANYTREIAPHELPELLGVSHGHFCCLFKRCFGMPFSNYLVDYRLERALELLGEPESNRMNIAGISQSVGFSSYAYFARCFKRRYGLSMSEYLRR